MKLVFKKSFDAVKESVPEILKFFSGNIGDYIPSREQLADCLLAVDEAATNIVMHAYGPSESGGEQPVLGLSVTVGDEEVVVEFTDQGAAFDPGKAPPPDIHKNLAGKRRGGFGLFLIKKLIDDYKYTRKNGTNYLTLWIKLRSGNSGRVETS